MTALLPLRDNNVLCCHVNVLQQGSLADSMTLL